MKKYMNWTVMILVGLSLFWASVIVENTNSWLFWNIYSYSSSLKDCISAIMDWICIAGIGVILLSLIVLPSLALYDGVNMLERRRVIRKENKKCKWLM